MDELLIKAILIVPLVLATKWANDNYGKKIAIVVFVAGLMIAVVVAIALNY